MNELWNRSKKKAYTHVFINIPRLYSVFRFRIPIPLERSNLQQSQLQMQISNCRQTKTYWTNTS